MTSLKVGDKAPAFNALNENEQTISLSDFTGKKVILYFYPKDDTPGCTIESKDFSKLNNLISKNFIEINDIIDLKDHKRFTNSHLNYCTKWMSSYLE